MVVLNTLIYLANSAVLMQIRVGVEVSKQYFITSLNGNRAILVEDGGHFISLYVGSNKVFLYLPFHLLAWIFPFPFKLLCCSWLLQRVHCPIIPKPGLLSTVTWCRNHVILCTVHPAVPCIAVEATLPSLFLNHFVSPRIMGRLLKKIT